MHPSSPGWPGSKGNRVRQADRNFQWRANDTIRVTLRLGNVVTGLARIQAVGEFRYRLTVEGRDPTGKAVRRYGFADSPAVVRGESTMPPFAIESVDLKHFLGQDQGDGHFGPAVLRWRPCECGASSARDPRFRTSLSIECCYTTLYTQRTVSVAPGSDDLLRDRVVCASPGRGAIRQRRRCPARQELTLPRLENQ